MTTTEAKTIASFAVATGMARIIQQPDLTARGTPRKRSWLKLNGFTKEQKEQRHRQQIQEYHKRHNMSIDTANQIINEQEDAIKELRHQVLDREDQRDAQSDIVLELRKILRRIECAEDIATAHRIAGEAVARIGV